MQIRQLMVVIGLAILFLAPVILAATTATTTMTWVVPSSKSHSIAYGGSCNSTSFVFDETNCLDDGGAGDIDGNGTRCLPYNASGGGGTACQSSTVAGMTITNNGNVTSHIDANFLTLFATNDINLVLKVWMGTGAGCGTSGAGGWVKDCTVTGATSPVTATTCRTFSAYAPNTATTGGRLVTSLASNDTNQLCFSGDFNGFQNSATFGVPQGSRTFDFNTTST